VLYIIQILLSLGEVSVFTYSWIINPYVSSLPRRGLCISLFLIINPYINYLPRRGLCLSYSWLFIHSFILSPSERSPSFLILDSLSIRSISLGEVSRNHYLWLFIHTFNSLSRTAFECPISNSLGEVSKYHYLWQLIHMFISLSRTEFEWPISLSLGEVYVFPYSW
jgi:hypothetical protein